MQQVHFDPSGSSLSVNIRYESNHAENLFVTYTYTLWEAQSGAIVDKNSGNNFNNSDDNYRLPTPAEKNNGRVIDILSTLKNAGSEGLNARVVVEICQDGNSLQTVIETERISENSTVVNQIFIRVTA